MRRGDLTVANQYLTDALEQRQITQGPSHPDSLSAAAHLAALRRRQGSPTEATSLYREVVAGRLRSLGPRDPEYLSALNNLAMCYLDEHAAFSLIDGYGMAHVLHAEAMLTEATATACDVLGGSHPQTMLFASNLAALERSKFPDWPLRATLGVLMSLRSLRGLVHFLCCSKALQILN